MARVFTFAIGSGGQSLSRSLSSSGSLDVSTPLDLGMRLNINTPPIPSPSPVPTAAVVPVPPRPRKTQRALFADEDGDALSNDETGEDGGFEDDDLRDYDDVQFEMVMGHEDPRRASVVAWSTTPAALTTVNSSSDVFSPEQPEQTFATFAPAPIIPTPTLNRTPLANFDPCTPAYSGHGRFLTRSLSKTGLMEFNAKAFHEFYHSHLRRGLELIILDCRFESEFSGGHIRGATHIQTTEQLDKVIRDYKKKGRKVSDLTIVTHCEFSQHRGVRVLQHLIAKSHVMEPVDAIPCMILLAGGFCNYFSEYPEDCVGTYVTMLSDENSDQLLNRFNERFVENYVCKRPSASALEDASPAVRARLE